MLVLSRRPGETVHIGSEIMCTVLAAKGNRARIGITRRMAAILRGELPDPAGRPSRATNPNEKTDDAI